MKLPMVKWIGWDTVPPKEEVFDREETRLVLKEQMNNCIPESIQDKVLWEEYEHIL